MFQVLASEFLGRGDDIHVTADMLCISVIIVAIGASRIYRGLVDHSVSSHQEAQESPECWGGRQPESEEVKDSDIV
jgi:hypothetical protein